MARNEATALISFILLISKLDCYVPGKDQSLCLSALVEEKTLRLKQTTLN